MHLLTVTSVCAMEACLFILYTVGKISIERIINCLIKYISKGAIEIKFSADVSNDSSNPHMQRNQTTELSYVW